MIDLNKLIGKNKGVVVITGFDQTEYTKVNIKQVIANCYCNKCGRNFKLNLSKVYYDRPNTNVYDHNCPECKEEYRKEQIIKRFTNKVNGNLKFLNFDHFEGTRAFVKCLCLNCNKEVIVRDDKLTTKHPPYYCENCRNNRYRETTKARYYKLTGLTGKEYEEDKRIRNRLSSLKQGAKDRNFSYDLPDDIGEKLLQQPCHYCGSTEFIGLDRIDSTQGYSENNCVSCCKICNKMKNNFSYKDFLTKVHKIYKNLLENSTTIENTEKSGSE